MHKDVRIEVKAQNNILWHAIFDVWSSVARFCKESKVNQGLVGKLLNLKISPLGANGDYREICVRLQEILGIECSELFPLELYGIEQSVRVFEISLSELSNPGISKELVSKSDPESEIIDREFESEVARCLATLSPSEEWVLRRRYGFDGESEHTLDEISCQLKVSRERVRQIELEGLDKLRRPSRSKPLKAFLSGNDDPPRRNVFLEMKVLSRWSSISEFCKSNYINENLFHGLLNCMHISVIKDKEFSPLCKEISEILGVGCDVLFPTYLYEH